MGTHKEMAYKWRMEREQDSEKKRSGIKKERKINKVGKVVKS
jgi:hypothetical protein